jgi:hypothetical protein
MSTNTLDPQIFYTNLLTDPKRKMSARWRRTAWRTREKAFLSTQQPKDSAKKLAEKVLTLPAGRLVKFLKQSARKAATAKYLLVKLDPDSRFRGPLEHEQSFQLAAFACAKKEYNFRAGRVG